MKLERTREEQKSKRGQTKLKKRERVKNQRKVGILATVWSKSLEAPFYVCFVSSPKDASLWLTNDLEFGKQKKKGTFLFFAQCLFLSFGSSQ
jgi:hypothetical protein